MRSTRRTNTHPCRSRGRLATVATISNKILTIGVSPGHHAQYAPIEKFWRWAAYCPPVNRLAETTQKCPHFLVLASSLRLAGRAYPDQLVKQLQPRGLMEGAVRAIDRFCWVQTAGDGALGVSFLLLGFIPFRSARQGLLSNCSGAVAVAIYFSRGS